MKLVSSKLGIRQRQLALTTSKIAFLLHYDLVPKNIPVQF